MPARHFFYDHSSVAGDPVSELRDGLAARGWSVRLAHTGGGVMSVEVAFLDGRTVLIGPDGNQAGGWDLTDSSGNHVDSSSFEFPAGEIVDAADTELHRLNTSR